MVAEAEPFRVIIRPRALADLEEIHGYIAEDSEENANRYAQVLLESIRGLSHLPTIYAVRDRRKDPALSVRAKIVDLYIIYFRVNESTRVVDVLTIRHGARRQPKRFR